MIHASYITGDKVSHLTEVACGTVGRCISWLLVICAFCFFEHALICIRPPHPSFDFFLHPQLEKKTITNKVLLLLLLIPYLMYALFFTCIATTAESTPAFIHRAFSQRPTIPTKQTYTTLHHTPLFL